MSWWKFWTWGREAKQEEKKPTRPAHPEFRFEVHHETGNVAVFIAWPEYKTDTERSAAAVTTANMLSIMATGGLSQVISRTLLSAGQFHADPQFSHEVISRFQANLAQAAESRRPARKGPIVKPTDVFGINKEPPRDQE